MDTTHIYLARPLIIVTILVAALAGASCNQDTTRSVEERAQEIDKLLICPVCPAETIDQAQVELAKDMRRLVREKLSQGSTKEEVLNYFSAPERYGVSVLAAPPKSGANLTAWIVPPILVLVGGILTILSIRAMKKPRYFAEDDLDKGTLSSYLSFVDRTIESKIGTDSDTPPIDRDPKDQYG